MLDLVVLAFTFAAVWKVAALEDRTPWAWAVGALVAQFSLMRFGVFGGWYFLYPVATFVGVLAGLWWVRSNDDRDRRNRPGSGIVR